MTQTQTTIASQNIYFLRQGLELLDSLDAELFTTTDELSRDRGTIGAHLRHCIDYYRCFLRGLGPGRVDYDERQRQARVESDLDAARAALTEIIAGLETLGDPDPAQRLAVRVDAAAWQDPADSWSHSSLARELQFLLSHTVHHYALIALVLRGRGIEPHSHFGMAPSTVEHQGRRSGQDAPRA